MKKFFHTSLVLSVIIIFFVCTLPLKSYALVPPLVGFGGTDSYDDYESCDCSGAVYTWFTPLYINSPLELSGPLAWYPGSIAFSYYFPEPGKKLVGAIVPGVQACWMTVAYFCIPIPTYGVITSETGVSLF